MGWFRKKKKSVAAEPPEEVIGDEISQSVLDDAYREELRQLGRQYFGQIITEDKEALRREFTRTFIETSNDLRSYIRRQLSTVVDHVRQELSSQLERQLSDHRRILNDAQESAVQSLTRNSQELHERYGQLSRALERTVADQEAKMMTVFAENERQLNDMQQKQAQSLAAFKSSIGQVEQGSVQFQQSLDQLKTSFEGQVTQLIQNSGQQLEQTQQQQAAALQSVRSSAEVLQQQAASAQQVVDEAVNRQQQALIQTFEANFAQVVEHYLLTALGDQFNIKDQLPAIVAQLESDKAALVEDAKL